MPDISPREWRWVAAVGLGLLVLFSVPYVVGMLNATPQQHFSGFLLGLEDMYSYIAKMRYGARAGWDFHLVYTSEPHSGGYIFLPFLALGKLTALITGQGANVSADALIVSFHVARLICGAILLVVLYVFVSRFLTEPSQRRLAWLIAAAAGGLGWLEALAFGGSLTSHLPPVEFYVPEAFTSLILFSLPHLALARALLLAGWLALFRAVETGSWRWAAGAALAWLGMTLCVPFDGALLGVVVLVWLAGIGLSRRRCPAREIVMAAGAGAPTALYVAYNFWLFATNPIFAIWSSQNVLPSPPPIEYLVAFLPILALAIPGGVALARRRLDKDAMLLILWPVAAFVMIYLPVNVQRRLLEGAIVPLSILAASGLAVLWNVPSDGHRWTRVVGAALLAVMVPSALFLTLGEMVVASASDVAVFHSVDERAALEWLGGHAPADSIVLSTRESGAMLPAYAPVRDYLGHGPETVHSQEKIEIVAAFYSSGMDDSARMALLRDNHVRYVWIGANEVGLMCHTAGCFDPARLGLVEVFRSGSYAIDEVPQ